MPSRVVVAKELAEVFKVIAHPDRIRVIEELSNGESDVNSLAQKLELAGPRVSQHLNQLRAGWIVDALAFLEGRGTTLSKSKINTVRRMWTQ